MAGLVCSAIVGFLCVQAPIGGDGLTVRLEDKGLDIADTIQAKDWTVSWGRSMEWAPPRLDTSKLAKACDDGSCLSYWRRCDGTKCSYAIAIGGASGLFFDVTAQNDAGLKQAMDAIRIVVDIKLGTTVRLSKLDRDGPGANAPIIKPNDTPR